METKIIAVHVTKWTAKNTKADGSVLQGKFGPYWMVGIQTTEEEGWRNGFINGAEKPEDWTGKEVNLELFETEKDGKTYKNFRIPKKSSQEMADMDAKLEKLLNLHTAMNLRLAVIAEHLSAPKKKDYPTASNKTAFDEPSEFLGGNNDIEEQPF